MNFELTLKQEKVKPHQSTALHLLVAFTLCMSGALAMFLYKLFAVGLKNNDPEGTLNLLKWAGMGIILLGILLLLVIIMRHKWMQQPKVNTTFRVLELLALLFFFGFSSMQHITIPAVTYGILALATLAALFWENTKSAIKVWIDDDGVKLPFRANRRFIGWKEIEAVLLRYNVLTVDCLDNKLYQWDVQQVNFDIANFETYCKEKIQANKSKRVEDW